MTRLIRLISQAGWRSVAVVVAGVALATLTIAVIVLSSVSRRGADSDRSDTRESNLELLVSLLPDTEETRQYIYLYDYERMREVLGAPLPSDPSVPEALDEYLEAFPFGRTSAGWFFISGLSAGGRIVIRPETIGYGAAHVDGEAHAGVPPREFEAIVGRFDPKTIKASLKACKQCTQPEVRTYHGTEYYSWGEDFKQNLRSRNQPPVFDELGRGGRWFFSNRFILRTLWTAGIEAMIDASERTGSLLNDSDYWGLTRELAATKPSVAVITNQTPGPEFTRSLADVYQELGLPAPGGPMLRPLSLIASGCSVDEKGFFLVIVLAHSSEVAAHDNVDILRNRIESVVWPDGSTFSSRITHLEVDANGRVLTARLHGDLPCQAPDALFPLLLHE
jgi:hypothetical protein